MICIGLGQVYQEKCGICFFVPQQKGWSRVNNSGNCQPFHVDVNLTVDKYFKLTRLLIRIRKSLNKILILSKTTKTVCEVQKCNGLIHSCVYVMRYILWTLMFVQPVIRRQVYCVCIANRYRRYLHIILWPLITVFDLIFRSPRVVFQKLSVCCFVWVIPLFHSAHPTVDVKILQFFHLKSPVCCFVLVIPLLDSTHQQTWKYYRYRQDAHKMLKVSAYLVRICSLVLENDSLSCSIIRAGIPIFRWH